MTFFLFGNDTLNWEAEEDIVITRGYNNFVCTLSRDPDLKAVDYQVHVQNPDDTVELKDVLFWGGTMENIAFEVIKGQKIYVSPLGGPMYLQLCFEPLSADNILKEITG